MNSSKSTLNSEGWLGKFLQYVERNGGTRVLVGLALIFGLQLIFGLSWIGGVTEEREIELASLKTEVTTNRALAGDDTITERLSLSSKSVESFRKRVYEGPTIGLVSAEIESFLQKAAEDSNLDRVQISLNYEKTERDSIVRFVIDVSAQEKEKGVFPTFLSKVLTDEKAFHVSSMSWSGRVKRLKLTLVCVGRLTEAET